MFKTYKTSFSFEKKNVLYTVEAKLSTKTENRLDIDLNKCSEYIALSMTGDVFEKGWQSAGQINKELLTAFPDNEEVKEVCAIWKRWHLNELKAGTRIQEKIIEEYFTDISKYTFDEACALLKSKDLYKDRGYVYGSQWLVDPLPLDEAKRIKAFFQTLKDKSC